MNATHASLREPARRSSAATPYPFFSCMLKQGFFAAAALFVFAGGLYFGHFATTAWPGPAHWLGTSRPLEAVVLDKLKTELRLTPEQTAKIAPVIAAACSDMRLVSEQHRAQRLALLDEAAATIAPELNPAQQQRLQAMEAELQNRQPVKRDLRIVALY